MKWAADPGRFEPSAPSGGVGVGQQRHGNSAQAPSAWEALLLSRRHSIVLSGRNFEPWLSEEAARGGSSASSDGEGSAPAASGTNPTSEAAAEVCHRRLFSFIYLFIYLFICLFVYGLVNNTKL